MTFEQIFESARYNVFFWSAHASGILGVVLLLLCALRIRSEGLRKFSYLVVVLLVGVLVTTLTVKSVQRKWRIRAEAARTEQEREAACRDGANLVFSPIIGGFESIVYVSAGMLLVLMVRKARFSNKHLESGHAPPCGPSGVQP